MTNLQLKAEADRLLYGTGLHELLTHFTSEESIYISGSYALDTMAWRDLDLYIAVENITQQDVYKLMTLIMDRYEPVWFESKNTTGEVGVPNGFFLGFETLKIDHHLWNVDIWFVENEVIKSNRAYMSNLISRLDDTSRENIIRLKQELIASHEYGTLYKSVELYDAVIERGISTIEGFKG